MSDYAIFFDYNNKTYRLPVNPEEIETSSTQAIEKYEILKLGQISVPTHMELKEYSFETELPKYSNTAPHYAEISKKFHGSDYYLSLFKKWRKKLVPVRFIAGRFEDSDKDNEIDDGEIDLNKCINTLVLIEELTITEKAGEEGDKYVSFKLLEYKDYGKHESPAEIDEKTGKKKKKVSTKTNPKSTGYYIVKNGDSLWTIAKKLYGDGSKCNVIYNANKDKIKNPNIITIGQKLTIPTSDEFSKYSAALPVMKTTAVTKAKSVSLVKEKAVVGERSLAGISLLLDSVSGVSNGGYSQAGGSGRFLAEER